MMRNQTGHYPPADHSVRAERPDPEPGFLEQRVHEAGRYIVPFFTLRREMAAILPGVNTLAAHFSSLGDAQLKEETAAVSLDLHSRGLTPFLVARSFALVRESAKRTLGQYHYDSQILGGRALLCNAVAEMATGEGKTLTATLAAATMALAGVPVHVISVNDYLTSRDAEEMGPLYRALGLSVGCVVQGMPLEARRGAYACRITYVTNKEIVFDYLRDRLTLGGQVDPLRLQAASLHEGAGRTGKLLLRGLYFALVDEADSILIDEARTPLIISGSNGDRDGREFMAQALSVAGGLSEDEDFLLDLPRRQVSLTEKGRHRIGEETAALGDGWSGMARREGMIATALSALHLFHRDEQYLVRDDKVEIIDEFTGRVMPGRSWEQGLHQLIEIKEGCSLTSQRDPLAKISYQRFFRRYLALSGMTGTAKEVAGELWSVYGLPTLPIPTNRPLIRKHLAGKILPTLDAKWQAVVDKAQAVHGKGRPVLIGTRSVAASECLSRLMNAQGLPHQVLNAKQDKEEADIVSLAGETGRVTIATNMAGRGTDIKLGPGVREAGGLHVIATERHEAARIDRQLAGRCGRQGDPGSYEEILSMEDSLLAEGAGYLADVLTSDRLAWHAMGRAQKKIEKYHGRIRRELLRKDQEQGSLLSFSGRME